MRILIYDRPDDTALFGSDPEAIKNVDVKASRIKYQEMLAQALAKEYPNAEIEFSDAPKPAAAQVLEDDGYNNWDDLPFVEQVIHDVWESWAWIVEKEAK